MNTTINKLELASELADKKLNELHQEELKNNNAYYPNGIVKEDENGDVVYTEEAQDDFNLFYDEYLTLIDKAQTPEQNETFYFTLIDEEGKTAGIIHTGNSRQLESFVMDCAMEHYSVDDVSIPESLEIAKLDWGVQKTITVTCYIGKEPPIYYDMVIEKSVAYGNKPSQEKTLYQVQNSGGNPAGTEETNPDAIFLSEESANIFKEYLHEDCDIDMKTLKTVKL